MVSYVILLYPIPLHSIVRCCVVGFGERAVSRKTPLYFIISADYEAIISITRHQSGGICTKNQNKFDDDYDDFPLKTHFIILFIRIS